MTRRKFKFTALILLISLIFGALSVFASDGSMAEIRSLKAHDDPNFPVDFRLSVSENQKVLDPGETIPESVKLKISMKEEYADTYCYMNHLSIKEDENTIIENGEKALPLLSDTAIPADNALNVDIVPEYAYNFSFEIYTRTATITYLGIFYTGYDWDGTFCAGVSYHKYIDSSVETAATYAISNPMVSETEDNGTMATADTISLGAIAQGCMTATSDHDYYKFTTISGQSGYVDIRMHNPDLYWYVGPDLEEGFVTDYDLVVRNSNGTIIGSSYNREGDADEYVRIYVSQSTTYYIETVCYRENGSNETYTIETSYDQTFTWYTQMTSYCRSFDQYYTWNSHNMDKLYFTGTSFGETLPFMGALDNNSAVVSYRMEEGCAMAAAAMILRNMDAEMYGQDIRTGEVGYIIADPYSVTLANANVNAIGVDPDSSTGRWNVATSYIDPIAVQNGYESVAAHFNVTKQKINISGYTDEEKASMIENALATHSQGIVIQFSGHFIAFVGINSNYISSKGLENKFIVCDSGTSFADGGDNVPFNVCSSASYCDLSTAKAIYTFDY